MTILAAFIALGHALFFSPQITQQIVANTSAPAGGGGGGIAIVQPTAGNPLAQSCSIFASNPTTCAYPVNVTSGNQALVLAISGAAGTLGTPACSSGTATIGTFTAIGGGSSAGGVQQWFKAGITGSGSCTISVSVPASSNSAVLIFEVSGFNSVDTGTNPVYHSASCFTPTGCAAGSITPGTTSDLILFGITGGQSTTAYSALSPYTSSGTGLGNAGNNNAWMTGNYTAPSTSAINPTFSQGAGTLTYQDSSMAVK